MRKIKLLSCDIELILKLPNVYLYSMKEKTYCNFVLKYYNNYVIQTIRCIHYHICNNYHRGDRTCHVDKSTPGTPFDSRLRDHACNSHGWWKFLGASGPLRQTHNLRSNVICTPPYFVVTEAKVKTHVIN